MPRPKKKSATAEAAAEAKASVPAPTGDALTRLQRWNTIKPELARLQEEERLLRIGLASEMFDPTKFKGTERVDIGMGWKLKCTKEQNINGLLADDVWALFCYIALRDPALAIATITWKPYIHVKEYNKVAEIAMNDAELSALLAKAIEITPGMPTLEIEAPAEAVVEQATIPA